MLTRCCIVVSYQSLKWFQVPRLRTLSWCWNLRLQISQKHNGQHAPKQRSLHHWAQIQLLHVTHTPKAPQFSVQRCWSSWLQATAASKGSAELDQCRWRPRSKINKLFPCSLGLLSILWFKTPGSSSSLHLEDSMFPPGSWDLYMWNGRAAAYRAGTPLYLLWCIPICQFKMCDLLWSVFHVLNHPHCSSVPGARLDSLAVALTSECPLGSPRGPMTFCGISSIPRHICMVYIYQFTANPAWFLVEINQPPWLLALIPHLHKIKTYGKPQWVQAQINEVQTKKYPNRPAPSLIAKELACSFSRFRMYSCHWNESWKPSVSALDLRGIATFPCPFSIIPPYVLMCSIPAVGASRCQWHPNLGQK